MTTGSDSMLASVFSSIEPTVFILSIVVLLAAALTAYFVNKIRKLEKQRLKDLQEIEDVELVPAEGGSPYGSRRFIKNAASTLATKYTWIRRFVIPLIVLVAILLGSIPFLSGLAQSYASLVIGALTIILGIAARPFIENLISGLLLALGESVRTGDTILIDNNYGTIEEIKLTYSVVKIWDWRRYIVPNSEFLQKAFVNYSYNDEFVYTYVEFYVSYEADLELVEKLAKDSMRGSSSLASEHGDPTFWLMGMEKDSIKCWIAGWAESPANYWTLSHDCRKYLVNAFKENSIHAHLSHHNLQPKRYSDGTFGS